VAARGAKTYNRKGKKAPYFLLYLFHLLSPALMKILAFVVLYAAERGGNIQRNNREFFSVVLVFRSSVPVAAFEQLTT